ncbi:MAG TPA: low affinity iron permease family protein [Actinomycetales bacterium]|nr:low affinity iron permease family protein [Actinomycetales bacterium]
MSERPIVPTDVSDEVGGFDKFAEGASRLASRAWFFVFCVLLVVLWAPSIFVLKDIDTWQLIINTLTTIVTFLMVALLQNSQTRADQAVQHKLNAIADGLADLMKEMEKGREGSSLHTDIAELRAAVGLEQRESTSNNEVAAGGDRDASGPRDDAARANQNGRGDRATASG